MKEKNKIELLISPSNLKEARALFSGGADIIDVKNPAEGSLGANFPWVIRDIIRANPRARFSVAIGDIFYKPGSFSLAAYAAASLGADYVKAGFFGFSDKKLAGETARRLRKAVKMVRKKTSFVLAGYADWKRFGGLPWRDILHAASFAGADVVMLDTYVKDGKSLFDAMPLSEIRAFLQKAGGLGLKTALAGSLRPAHMPAIKSLSPDIIGIRGGVCRGFDRNQPISAGMVKKFKRELNGDLSWEFPGNRSDFPDP
ncbi:MAG: hypothetical protein COT17_01690 [Elusimicrobia bacterium CG08_land_8_20_14_0_20_51_18]|nr:MAG: hypothetical protein COT17_01690 [Elusimicrobia bacterium CG08_land_8_20_14_0_20_51_18]